jgi:hypothetical protein
MKLKYCTSPKNGWHKEMHTCLTNPSLPRYYRTLEKRVSYLIDHMLQYYPSGKTERDKHPSILWRLWQEELR